MKKNLYLTGIVVALILSACTKKTIIEETVTVVGQGPAEVDYYGVWKQQNNDPGAQDKYYLFEKGSVYGAILTEDQYGYRRKSYQTVLVTSTMFRVAGEQNRPYKLVGDTLTFLGGWNGPEERTVFVKVTDSSVTAGNWLKDLKVLRSVLVPKYHQNNVSTRSSLGIDGDFLYISAYNNLWKIYKLNTLNGMNVDSGAAMSNNINALYFKGSSNKLYHTSYSGTSNMQQRVGLNGVNSNLSSNALGNIRAISVNGTSGTVYAVNSSGQIYSGSEGGNFSSLFTITGNTPQSIVYYKSDQFLGVYNGNLILFEISPTFKIIEQYSLPGGLYMNQSIGTNGSDIWVQTYNNPMNRYEYKKVSIN